MDRRQRAHEHGLLRGGVRSRHRRVDAVRGPGPGASEGAGGDHVLSRGPRDLPPGGPRSGTRCASPRGCWTSTPSASTTSTRCTTRDSGYLAATNELMSLHVSQQTRRGAPMAPEILERLARIRAAHEPLPRPAPGGGASMGLAVATDERRATRSAVARRGPGLRSWRPGPLQAWPLVVWPLVAAAGPQGEVASSSAGTRSLAMGLAKK